MHSFSFAAAIESPETLVVPSLTLYEVFKRVCRIKDETAAFEAVAVMLQGRVVDFTGSLALDAARLSLETGLATADSIILATARSEDATLWTQDAHFSGLDKVEYRARPDGPRPKRTSRLSGGVVGLCEC